MKSPLEIAMEQGREIGRLLAIRHAPWWHFWNPRSGSVGGIITGVILSLIVVFLTGCSDDRPCKRTYDVPVTTYIQSGKVLIPIVSRHRVCAEYAA